MSHAFRLKDKIYSRAHVYFHERLGEVILHGPTRDGKMILVSKKGSSELSRSSYVSPDCLMDYGADCPIAPSPLRIEA